MNKRKSGCYTGEQKTQKSSGACLRICCIQCNTLGLSELRPSNLGISNRDSV